MASELTRLKASLLISGLQQKDIALFNIINQLLDAVSKFEKSIVGTSASPGSGSVSLLLNRTYLTAANELGILNASRQLLAGANITFDDSVAGQRTVNGSAPSIDTDHVIMTTGAEPGEILTDGFGSGIYIPYE